MKSPAVGLWPNGVTPRNPEHANMQSAFALEATWMAAGGSAPEFFTSIVGATIVPFLHTLLGSY